MKKILTLLIAILATAVTTAAKEKTIEGKAELKAGEMTAYIMKHNPGFDPAIAKAYIKIGKKMASEATSHCVRRF